MADVSERILAGIPVEVTRKRQKRIYLRVDPATGKVRVSAPTRTPFFEIEGFIAANMDWILEQQSKIMLENVKRGTGCDSGDSIYVWGRTYLLELVEAGRYNLELDGSRARLSVPTGHTPERRLAYLNRWYRQQLEEEIERVLPQLQTQMGLYCSSWQVRDMKTRWGSCTPQKRSIRLNLQLVKYPPECLQYVIIHELAHLQVPNHGPAFKAVMDRNMPQWRRFRKLLNDASRNKG